VTPDGVLGEDRTPERGSPDYTAASTCDPPGVPTSILTSPEARQLEEPDRVLLWRIVRLVEAGYDADSAVGLGLSTIDLHAAVELVERGCPPGLARAILE